MYFSERVPMPVPIPILNSLFLPRGRKGVLLHSGCFISTVMNAPRSP
jgi:hypothetical protein